MRLEDQALAIFGIHLLAAITVRLLTNKGDDEVAAQVIELSRATFARPVLPSESVVKPLPEVKTEPKFRANTQQTEKIAKLTAKDKVLDVT